MTNLAYHERRWRIPSCRTTTLIPFLLIPTIVIAFWIFMGESAPPPPPPPTMPTAPSHFVYSTVPGFFAQDDPATDDATFDYVQANFGLVDQAYDTDGELPTSDSSTQWQRFEHKLARLNQHAPAAVSYRLLFLGRHGQGYHNVAEAFYGTAAWDCYYSTLNGTANMTWADAHLTPLGVTQAQAAQALWRRQITARHMPAPQAYYASPLARALHTAQLTFAALPLPRDRPFQPTVKEGLREGIGVHTCDRRSSRSAIAAAYPAFRIETGFAEEDALWAPELREPGAAQTVRSRRLLDDVFAADESTWISMTSHSGTMQSVLRAVGHREFRVATGGVLPVLVRLERREGERPAEEEVPWEGRPECEDFPLKEGSTTVEASLEALDAYVRGTGL